MCGPDVTTDGMFRHADALKPISKPFEVAAETV